MRQGRTLRAAAILVFMLSQTVSAQITITDVSPAGSWDNVAEYVADLTGDNLLLGSTVTLSKAGAADIAGTILDAAPPTSLTVEFDLTGAPFGLWHITVTHPVMGSATLTQAVNVRRSPRFDRLGAWGGPVQASAVVGDLAYVARGSGLVILDVSDPTDMSELSALDLGGPVYSVTVSGNYAFVGGSQPVNLTIVDISDPSSPEIVVAGLTARGAATGVTVHGNVAYVEFDGFRDNVGDLYALDITDIETLEPPGVFLRVYAGGRRESYDQTMAGGLFYNLGRFEDVCCGPVLHIMDPSVNPLAPTVVGSAAFTLDRLKDASAVAVNGDFAYITATMYDGGALLIVDVSNPAAPYLTGLLEGFGAARDVSVSNGYAYIADPVAPGMVVVDVSNPFLPTRVANFSGPSGAPIRSLTVFGSTAFVGNGGDGLIAVDVSDATIPTRLGNWHSPAFVRDIDKEGDLLYLTDYWYGVTVLNVGDPQAPVLVGAHPTAPENGSLRVRNGIAYVAAGWDGLEVVDLSDPINPSVLTTYTTGNRARSVALRDHVLIVGFANAASVIFDVTDAVDPIPVGTLDGNADWVINEDFLALSTTGKAYGVSDPYHPIAIGSCLEYEGGPIACEANWQCTACTGTNPAPCATHEECPVGESCVVARACDFSHRTFGGDEVAVEGNRVYSARDGEVRFAVITEDRLPTHLASIPKPAAWSIAAQAGLVYVGSGSGELRIYDGVNVGSRGVHTVASTVTYSAGRSVHADWPYVYLGGVDQPGERGSSGLTIFGRAAEPTVNLALRSNVPGVTITGDGLGPIGAPDGFSVPTGTTYTGLTAQHRPSRTEALQRFDSWQRVEGYDEDGRPRWVVLSKSPSLDLSLTQDLQVRSPVTGEFEVAIQARFVPAVRSKDRDSRRRLTR